MPTRHRSLRSRARNPDRLGLLKICLYAFEEVEKVKASATGGPVKGWRKLLRLLGLFPFGNAGSE